MLWVDNHTDALELASSKLEMWGHEVRPVKSSHLALSTAVELLPEVIFLDLELCRPDSFEVAQQIRQHPRTAEIFLVAVGFDIEETRERLIHFNACLLKPLNIRRFKLFTEAISSPNLRITLQKHKANYLVF